MKKTYEVWTQGHGYIGVQLFSGNKWQCNSYIRQAVKKGAKPNHFTILVKSKKGDR